jgi:hypothetical protein
MQREVTAALEDFALKLYSLSVGKPNSLSSLHSSTLGAATSQPQPQGGTNTS